MTPKVFTAEFAEDAEINKSSFDKRFHWFSIAPSIMHNLERLSVVDSQILPEAKSAVAGNGVL